MQLLAKKTARKSRRGRMLGLESLEHRELFALADLPVLMVIADRRDFYWQEYGHTRQSLEAAGLDVVVAATSTQPSTPHSNSGQGAASGIVTPDITLAAARAADYSAIVFVGGYGASMYQYAWPGDYYDNHYDGSSATKLVVNNLVNDFVAQDKYVTAICHGVMNLAWARVNGVSPINGKYVSVPWLGSPGAQYQGQYYNPGALLQSVQATANGATTPPRSGAVGNPATIADDVIVDGRIITAENQDSAYEFGRVIAGRIWAESTPRVSALTALPNGARITFDRPQATSGLNLYDYRDPSGSNVLGAADVQLTGATTGVIAGSLVVDAAATSFTFLATQGALAPDTYTLRVRSGADAFRSAAGEVLDGDANGIAGGDYVRTFAVSAGSTPVLSLPSFVRGPGQAVTFPAAELTSLPLRLSAGAGATDLQFELRFDPGLLAITNVTAPNGNVVWNTNSPGILTATVHFAAPLSAGAAIAADVHAAVPTTATNRYGATELLDLANVRLTGPGGISVAVGDVDAVHVNAYFGDLGGNGRYDSYDVQQASRLALDLDTGLQAFARIDPTLLGDVNANGRLDSFDVQRVSRLALDLPVTEVPALPGAAQPPSVAAESGDDDTKPYHNARSGLRSDIDENGSVDAQDILWALDYFERTGGGEFTGEGFPQLKFDVNGDNLFAADDILTAVQDLSQPTRFGDLAVGESTANHDAALALLLWEDSAARKKHVAAN